MENTPTVNEVANSAKWFEVNKTENTLTAYIDERDGGWEGYRIELRFLNEIGYFWDLSKLWASYTIIPNHEGITADKSEAFTMYGICPKCKGDLFFKFNSTVHDVQSCGKAKKALVENVIG